MKLNVFLLVVLVISVAANLAIKDDPAKRNIEAMPEMVHGLAYKSFSPNPNFADGKTLQLPPSGTIARRVAVVSAKPDRGAHVYQVYCTPCHGGAGKGDGAVAMRGFPPPPSLMAEHAIKLTDEQMFDIVSHGQKNMPSYASQIPPEDRIQAIRYVRSLQEVKP